MSKTFMTPMVTVMKTVITVGQICGTTTRKNACTSLAPSMRAASIVSVGTPLIAADSSTIENPTCAQTRMTMRNRLFRWKVDCWSQTTGSKPSAVTIAFCRPICGRPAGRAS